MMQLRNGGKKEKLDIVIADVSNRSVKMSIWGNLTHNPCFKLNQIFGVKSAVVKLYREEKTISYGF